MELKDWLTLAAVGFLGSALFAMAGATVWSAWRFGEIARENREAADRRDRDDRDPYGVFDADDD